MTSLAGFSGEDGIEGGGRSTAGRPDSSESAVDAGLCARVVQVAVVLALGVSFLLYASAELPPENKLLPHRGVALFAIAGVLGRIFREREFHYGEALGAFLVAFFVLFFPVAASDPPSRLPGFVGAGLAFETCFALWGLLRFPSHTSRRWRPITSRVRRAVWIGCYMATGLSLFVAFLVAVAALGALIGADVSGFWLMAGGAVVAYYVAALVAGSLVGAVAPISAWPLGAMLVGILAAALVYAPVGVVVVLWGPEVSLTMVENFVVAGVLGLLLGPGMGVSFRYGGVLENWGVASRW